MLTRQLLTSSEIKSSCDKDKTLEFILSVKKDAEMYKRLVSFTNAQSYLRFLAVDEKAVTDKMIYTDFGGGLKKVMVFTNDNERFFFLEEKYLLKWAVPREVLFSVADRNMARFLDSCEIKHFEITKGVNALEISCNAKMLSASLMMCGGFRTKIHEKLGPKFLVLAPSRENIIVLDNITNNLLERLSTIIVKEYRHSKFPLTTNVFLFTPDSVKVAGHFKTSSW